MRSEYNTQVLHVLILQACITSFLNTVLEDQKEIPDLPMKKSLPGLCRNSVLITENELHALVGIRLVIIFHQLPSTSYFAVK